VTDHRIGPVEDSLVAGPLLAVPADGVGDTARFRSGLLDAMAEEGLEPWDAARLEGARKEAMRRVAARGLPPVRPWVPGVSALVRANRAEGWYAGGGVVVDVGGRASLRTTAGYRWGPSHPAFASRFEWRTSEGSVALQVRVDEARDLGLAPTAAGAVNTLGLLLSDTDWRDLFYVRGIEASFRSGGMQGRRLQAGLRVENHRSARLRWGGANGEGAMRPVRAVDEGTLAEGWIRVESADAAPTAGLGSEHDLSFGAGVLGGRRWSRAHGRLRLSYRDPALREVVGLQVEAGASGGSVPAQRWFLLGGRGSLPGFAYRGFAGRAFFLARLEGTRDVVPGWLGLRALGALGATGRTPESLPPGWEGVGGTAGLRASLGLGVALVGNALRLDLAHGLGPGGIWELVVSLDPGLGPFL
jgi:hypothetical protein